MTTSKSSILVVTGYCILAAGMLAFLTINGVPAPAAGTITTIGLLALGLLLPAAGMLELARHNDPPHPTLRKGLILQSLSLIGILIGLVVSYIASSLSGHQLAAVFIVPSGLAGLAGAIFISKQTRARQLIIGAALIAVGAALIPASDIAQYTYLMLGIDKNVYQDIGATIAACGCVVAAYSFFVLRSRTQAAAVSPDGISATP